ncbi:MAG: cytochrome c biogenesis protein CcsA [Bacteroidales bacterium]|nr:cytochrome c biogenesis protein CcsA [Bacteroidales bacterium]
MKNFIKSLFSMQLTVVLLLMFAISIAIATFIENDYGSAASKVAVYNALWFEILLVFLSVNLIGSLIEHKVWQRKKYVTFLMHTSFVVILIGAAITRFTGYEGMMHIREGESTNTMLSDNTYISARWKEAGNEAIVNHKVLLSGYGRQASPFSIDAGSERVRIKTIAFVPNAGAAVTPVENGEPVVSLFALTNTGRQTLMLRQGDFEQLDDFYIAFTDLKNKRGLQLSISDGNLFFSATDTVYITGMGSQNVDTVPANVMAPFQPMQFYNIGNLRIVLRAFEISGAIHPVNVESNEQSSGLDAVVLKVTYKMLEEDVVVWGRRGILGKEVKVRGFDQGEMYLSYGSRPVKIPFRLHLNEFILDRYPGSNSPSSYASEVTLIDDEKDISFDFRIFMNHILTHRGYRFYQSSYDTDEKGTILSVNHDGPGTAVTYFGYAMMTLAMILMLITRRTRFRYLLRTISEIRLKKSNLTMLLLLIMVFSVPSLFAQQMHGSSEAAISAVDKNHAAKFGRLTVLSANSRLEPMNTLNSKILRKISGKSNFRGMNPDQVILGIMAETQGWQHVPIIKVKNRELRRFLNINSSYASFADFFDPGSRESYKLSNYVNQAYRKNPFDQSQFDKDVINVDEKVNIFYTLLSGGYLALFPDINNPAEKWYHPNSSFMNFPEADSNFVKNIIPVYLESLAGAMKTGDYAQADEFVEAIGTFQQKFASEILLSEKKQNIEILYNKIEIFERLYKYYGMIGLIFLIVLFVKLVNPKIKIGIASKLMIGTLFLFFVMQTLGLAARWYVSGHAPLSNGYESMIYIAWATMLAGFLFVKKSNIALAATSVLASLTLFVAHLNWMNPEITNLVPVLKSVWLTIHVGVITASYGFLGLVMIMGIFNLMLMIFQTKKNYHIFNLTIREISLTIELAMTIGLYMITIGSFLGGIWANESWGRYWGWDPKETWSLVTILVYTIILHVGYVPGLTGRYLFNALAVIGFSSVLMTYFGVNYYLAGLHSYAGGDPVPVPTFVYYTLAILFIILLMAFVNNQKMKQLEKELVEKD